MSALIPPPGVYVPVPTFFSSVGTTDSSQPELDLSAQSEHAVFLAKAGIKGLVILGSTGEAIHLSRQERKDAIRCSREGLDRAGFKDYPIMAGVLSNGIDDTLEWLHDMAEAGAQWGLVLVPGYFGAAASQEGIEQWFTRVADRSPIPVLIYNYPGVTNNVVVEPATYRKLAAHPNIVGCKMSHGTVSHHMQVSLDPEIDHEKFRVYSGFGQQLGPIVLFNAAGVIDGLSAIYPRTVVKLFDQVTKAASGDQEALAEARRLQYIVSKAEEFVGKTGVVGITNAVFRVTGLGNEHGGRLPIRGTLSDAEWEKWRGLYLTEIEKEEESLKK